MCVCVCVSMCGGDENREVQGRGAHGAVGLFVEHTHTALYIDTNTHAHMLIMA